jgi:spore photoproduct lyase
MKSKNTHVDELLEVDHGGSDRRLLVLERGANRSQRGGCSPDIEARLRARSQSAGGRLLLGFHFDPMIDYPDWRQGYRENRGPAVFPRFAPSRLPDQSWRLALSGGNG